VKQPGGGLSRPVTNPPADADTLPPQHLKVDITDAEKTALAAQARDDVAETSAMIAEIDRQLLSAEALEKLKTAESLLAAAQSAGDRDDIAGMATLARKARLLTAELLPR
jgi:hypothetical protein